MSIRGALLLGVVLSVSVTDSVAVPGNHRAETQFSSRAGMERIASVLEQEAAELGLSLEDQRKLTDVVVSMEPSIRQTVKHVRCVPSVCEIVFDPQTQNGRYEITNALIAGVNEAGISYVSGVAWDLPGASELYVLYLIREPMIAHLNP